MASCTLEIGGLVVATAEGGPFDMEYALFEAHEIELRANNEPGNVRENGYQTTVELARERLLASGVTLELAEAVAGDMGALVASYARGPEVRRVASLLSARELFEGRRWNAETKQYDGGWLEIAALAKDSGVEGAARALQALHLAALLHDAQSDAKVFLSTAAYSAGRKAGARSHRRVSLGSVAKIGKAISTLAEKRAPRTLRDGGATRAELLESVRSRLVLCANDEARARLQALEHALAVRERPQKGPLADADLWAVELQLADRDTSDVQEKLDALERARGRAPGTTYLRARLSFILGDESARAIAERASSLALSMSAFPELELLAAEAWTRAGERRRALAYVRDLTENPQVDAQLRARARALVEGASAPSGERPALARPTTPSVAADMLAAADAHSPEPEPPDTTRASEPAIVAITTGTRASYMPPQMPSAPPPSAPPAAEASAPSAAAAATPPASAPPGAPSPQPARVRPPQPTPEAAPPPEPPPPPPPAPAPPVVAAPPRPDPPEPEVDVAPREASIEPLPIVDVRGSFTPMPPSAPVPYSEIPHAPSVGGGRATEGAAPWLAVVAPEPQGAPSRTSTWAPPPSGVAPPPPLVPSWTPPMRMDQQAGAFVKGGSQPPFRTEPPPPHFPAMPLVPRLEGGRVERAEALSLPPGLHGERIETLPTNAMEARIYFTQRSRELGRIYRTRFGVELQTDVASIEAMQRHLAERFEGGTLRTPEEVEEVRLHGAFLSEVLARRLGAEWVDLGVSEPGYWAMNVPPGARVWPIGRVIRFVTMQHRERDLVSYFLELQARAHGLR